MKNEQQANILHYLEGNHSITKPKASRLFGCQSLVKVIGELRSGGHEIKREMIRLDGKLLAKYTLAN